MGAFFHEILYRPLFNVLIWLYQNIAFEDLGVAIILLTILIRVVLFPIFYKSTKNQMMLQRLQPHVKKIQEDHKHNRERQAQALMELYRTHRVNPFSGFLLLFIQLPILIALYRVFASDLSLTDTWSDLYSFIPRPEEIHSTFLGLIDLIKRSTIVVALAAITQYLQGRMSLASAGGGSSSDPATRMSRQMVFMGPILTVVFLFSLPAAIGLYWLTTSLFSLGQQVVINRSLKSDGSTSAISGTNSTSPPPPGVK